MNGQPQDSLPDLLYDQSPDVNRVIDTFVSRFNAVYGTPASARWDISKEDWQRYAFLGDRVLNLIVVQSLFTRREGALTKGRMTRILSHVVSNRALDSLSKTLDPAVFSRLIPASVGGQETYGERITGGAFEAFIGALYCEVGLDDVSYFVMTILSDAISSSDPDRNAIGKLQEYFQKKYRALPTYRQMKRSGPDHKPVYIFQVLFNNEILGEGSGESIRLAQQDAAQKALDRIGGRS
jgi:ribonuclease III